MTPVFIIGADADIQAKLTQVTALIRRYTGVTNAEAEMMLARIQAGRPTPIYIAKDPAIFLEQAVELGLHVLDEFALASAEPLLTFADLRVANLARLPQFRDKHGRLCHPHVPGQPPGFDWKLTQWSNAVLGELGELANLLKKVERGDYTLDEVRQEVADELCDVATYLDILAHRCGVQLDVAILKKWNEVSDRVGSDVRLEAGMAAEERVMTPEGLLFELLREAVLGANNLGASVDAVQALRKEYPGNEFLNGAEAALLWAAGVRGTATESQARRWYMGED